MGSRYIEKALELDSDWEELYFQQGKIFSLIKKYKEAHDAVTRGLAIKKTEAGILTLFDILNAMDRNDEALVILDDNRHHLKDYEVRYAFILYKKGQYQKAIPYLQEALKKKQGEEYVLLHILANSYKSMNQPDTAEAYYLQSLQKEEMNKQAQLSLGELYQEQGRIDEACKVYFFIEQYWEVDNQLEQRLNGCHT
jgi:tetratricopeptide (TPR) repeat protein